MFYMMSLLMAFILREKKIKISTISIFQFGKKEEKFERERAVTEFGNVQITFC